MGRKTAQSAQPTPLPIGKSLFYLTDRCSKKEADDGNGRRALGVGEAVCSLTSTSGSATSGASRDPSPPSPTGHRTAFGLEVAAGLAKKKKPPFLDLNGPELLELSLRSTLSLSLRVNPLVHRSEMCVNLEGVA